MSQFEIHHYVFDEDPKFFQGDFDQCMKEAIRHGRGQANKELEADCAVMREAVQCARALCKVASAKIIPATDDDVKEVLDITTKALATESGKALLAQLQAHQQALKEAKVALRTCKVKKAGYRGLDTVLWFDATTVDAALTTMNSVLGSKGDE